MEPGSHRAVRDEAVCGVVLPDDGAEDRRRACARLVAAVSVRQYGYRRRDHAVLAEWAVACFTRRAVGIPEEVLLRAAAGFAGTCRASRGRARAGAGHG